MFQDFLSVVCEVVLTNHSEVLFKIFHEPFTVIKTSLKLLKICEASDS